jgi:hypothetical protein
MSEPPFYDLCLPNHSFEALFLQHFSAPLPPTPLTISLLRGLRLRLATSQPPAPLFQPVTIPSGFAPLPSQHSHHVARPAISPPNPPPLGILGALERESHPQEENPGVNILQSRAILQIPESFGEVK